MKKNAFAAVFLVILLMTGVCTLIFRGQDFSKAERRYLSPRPQNFSLSDWQLKEDTEKYLGDRLFLRQPLVMLNSGFQYLTGRRSQLDAWPVRGMRIEKPIQGNENGEIQVSSAIQRTADFEKASGLPCSFLIVPSAGAVMAEEMSFPMGQLYEKERRALENIENAGGVSVSSLLSSDPRKTYYHTDHHWTLQGAYMAYQSLTGDEALPLDAFKREEFADFSGSTAARSGLPVIKKDVIYTAEPNSGITFTTENGSKKEVYDTLIFPKQTETFDPYTVFMKGNHGFSVLENDRVSKGHLLVFKDSFANTLLPLLSAHYHKISAVDLRYFNGNALDALKKAENPEEVLFIYSLDSFLNDTAFHRKMKF